MSPLQIKLFLEIYFLTLYKLPAVPRGVFFLIRKSLLYQFWSYDIFKKSSLLKPHNKYIFWI